MLGFQKDRIDQKWNGRTGGPLRKQADCMYYFVTTGT